MSLRHRIEAYAALLRRYREIFRYHWQNRRQLGGDLFSEDEAEFLAPALSMQERPVSPASRLVAKILMALVAVLLLWSVLGQIDIIVNATGKIIPSSRTKTIASVDVASVKALHVEEGQMVKTGEVLIELDSSSYDAERDKAVGDKASAVLEMARSKALIEAVDNLKPSKLPAVEGVPPEKWQAAKMQLEAQYRDFAAKLKRIDGEIRRYQLALPLATQQARDYQVLAKDHDVSTHAWLEKEQARIDLEGQLTEAENQRAALIAETKRVAYDSFNEGDKMAGE
jgi:hemolysin D